MNVSKKPTREDLEEEIVSLSMTVKFLLDDVTYLLDNGASERKEKIREYINELNLFFNKEGKYAE